MKKKSRIQTQAVHSIKPWQEDYERKMLAQSLNLDLSISRKLLDVSCFSLLFLAGEIEALPALFSQN